MISLKKYLDSKNEGLKTQSEALEPGCGTNLSQNSDQGSGKADAGLLSLAISAYGEALREMGDCGAEACPVLGRVG